MPYPAGHRDEVKGKNAPSARRLFNRQGFDNVSVDQIMPALCVGGMVVARAMDDPTLADELREACMVVAFELGGWDRGNKSNGGKWKVN